MCIALTQITIFDREIHSSTYSARATAHTPQLISLITEIRHTHIKLVPIIRFPPRSQNIIHYIPIYFITAPGFNAMPGGIAITIDQQEPTLARMGAASL